MTCPPKALAPGLGIRLACLAAAATVLAAACVAPRAQVISLGPDLLPQQEAFKIETAVSEGLLTVNVDIADGYYLYKDRIGAVVAAGGARLSPLQLPEGKVYSDEFFGETEIYRGLLGFSANLERPDGSGDMLLELAVQGCADVGVCYAPYITSYAFSAGDGPGVLTASNVPTQQVGFAQPTDNTGGTVEALKEGSLPYIALLFFNAGILLAFTPCVLPMVPIALAIVTGGAKPGGRKAIALGGTYVLGMAVVYTLIGLLVAQSGSTFLTGSLQSPYVVIPMSLAFVALAVVMYRNINMRFLPASVSQRLSAVSCRPGTYQGALLAGGVSAIVVSPCVAVPLVGALIFIASTGDTTVGAVALFSLSLGMGVLPLAFAAGAGKFMPRTGPMSEAIKKMFALALVALAVWVLGSLVAPAVKLVAYAVIGLVAAAVLTKAALGQGISKLARNATGIVVAALIVFSGVLLLGGLTGAKNELAPLAHLLDDDGDALAFEVVSTEVDYQIAVASPGSRGVFEYYYADWCISCRELEAYTYRNPEVIEALAGYRLIKVDLTADNEDSRRMLAKNNLFGPPAIIVKDQSGMQRLRLVGYIDDDDLLEGLALLSGNT